MFERKYSIATVLFSVAVVAVISWVGGYYHHVFASGILTVTQASGPQYENVVLQRALSSDRNVYILAPCSVGTQTFAPPFAIAIDMGEVFVEYGSSPHISDSIGMRSWNIRFVNDEVSESIPLNEVSSGNYNDIWPPNNMNWIGRGFPDE